SLAGAQPAQLTNDSTYVFFPAYSPDGREIAFHGFRAGRRQVFVIGAAGGPATPLTHVAGDERAAAWAPGGRRVAMQRDFAGPDQRLDIVTGVLKGACSGRGGSAWTVRGAGGPARVLVRFDDPARPWHRYGFRARGGRFYFTVGDLESDIWVAELERHR